MRADRQGVGAKLCGKTAQCSSWLLCALILRSTLSPIVEESVMNVSAVNELRILTGLRLAILPAANRRGHSCEEKRLVTASTCVGRARGECRALRPCD